MLSTSELAAKFMSVVVGSPKLHPTRESSAFLSESINRVIIIGTYLKNLIQARQFRKQRDLQTYATLPLSRRESPVSKRSECVLIPLTCREAVGVQAVKASTSRKEGSVTTISSPVQIAE